MDNETHSLQQKLFEAMSMFTNQALNTSNNSIYECRILNAVKDSNGIYNIIYLNNRYTATSDNGVTYSPDDNVYVLVPNGDFSKNKIILGHVDDQNRLKNELLSNYDKDSKYYDISSNLSSYYDSLFGITTYKDDFKGDTLSTKMSMAEISAIINQGLSTSTSTQPVALIFETDIKTMMAEEQQDKGIYSFGIEIPVRLKDGTETSVISTCVSTRDMLGSPCHFDDFTTQSLEIIFPSDVDAIIATDINPIKYALASSGFPHDATKENITDIVFTHFNLVLRRKYPDINGGSVLMVVAEHGEWFTPNLPNTKTLTPVLYLNGKEVSISNCDIYWGIEDYDTTSFDGTTKLGAHWRILNTLTDNEKMIYDTSSITYEVRKDLVGQATRFKCVVEQKIDKRVVSYSTVFTLYNIDTFGNIKLIPNNNGKYQIGFGTAKVLIDVNLKNTSITQDNVRFSLQRTDKYGYDIEEVLEYHFVSADEHDLDAEVLIPVSAIDEINTLSCTAKYTRKNADNQYFIIGTDRCTLSTKDDAKYTLSIKNGGVTYTYDEWGNSPFVTSFSNTLMNQTAIQPLGYTIINNETNEEFSQTEYFECKFKWTIPKKSLFNLVGIYAKDNEHWSQDDDNYYFSGSGNEILLPYDIAIQWDIDKAPNDISLTVIVGDGATLTITDDIIFLKDGGSGTNGTRYTGQIVFNNAGSRFFYGQKDNNGFERKYKIICNVTGHAPDVTYKLYAYNYLENTIVPLENQQSDYLECRVYENGIELAPSEFEVVEFKMYDEVATNNILMGSRVAGMNQFKITDVRHKKSGDKQLHIDGLDSTNLRVYSTANIVKALVQIKKPGNTSSVLDSQFDFKLPLYYPIDVILMDYDLTDKSLLSNIPNMTGGYSEVLYNQVGQAPQYMHSNFKLVSANSQDILDDNLNVVWSGEKNINLSPVPEKVESVQEDGTLIIVNKYDEDGNLVVKPFEQEVIPYNMYDSGNNLNIIRASISYDKEESVDSNKTADEALEEYREERIRQLAIIDKCTALIQNYYEPMNKTMTRFQEKWNKREYDTILAENGEKIVNLKQSQTKVLTEIMNQAYKVISIITGDIAHFELSHNTKDKIMINHYRELQQAIEDLQIQIPPLISSVNKELGQHNKKLLFNCPDLDPFSLLTFDGYHSTVVTETELLQNLIDSYNIVQETGKFAEDIEKIKEYNQAIVDIFNEVYDTFTANHLVTDPTDPDYGCYVDYSLEKDELPYPEGRLPAKLYSKEREIYIKLAASISTRIKDFTTKEQFIRLPGVLGTEAGNNIYEYLSFQNGTISRCTAIGRADIVYIPKIKKEIDTAQKMIAEIDGNITWCETALVYIRSIVFYNFIEGLEYLNGWDGNKVEIGEDYITTPSFGAGIKTEENKFSGVVGGVLNQGSQNGSIKKLGIYGFNNDQVSFFLNARTGAASFGISRKEGSTMSGGGKIVIDPTSDKSYLYSSKYFTANAFPEDDSVSVLDSIVYEKIDSVNQLAPKDMIGHTDADFGNGYISNAGMLINLTDGGIRFGNGNFSVNSNGEIFARGDGIIAGWKLSNDRFSSPNDFLVIDPDLANKDDALHEPKIYSKNHANLTSKGKGFFLSHNGISFGDGSENLFTLDTSSKDIQMHLSGENSKIYSGTHEAFNSKTKGFYLGENGLSIGSNFSVSTEGTTNINVGRGGAIHSEGHDSFNATTNGFWLGETLNGSVIDSSKTGLSIGGRFRIDATGKLTTGGTTINADGGIIIDSSVDAYIKIEDSIPFNKDVAQNTFRIDYSGGDLRHVTTGQKFDEYTFTLGPGGLYGWYARYVKTETGADVIKDGLVANDGWLAINGVFSQLNPKGYVSIGEVVNYRQEGPNAEYPDTAITLLDNSAIYQKHGIKLRINGPTLSNGHLITEGSIAYRTSKKEGSDSFSISKVSAEAFLRKLADGISIYNDSTDSWVAGLSNNGEKVVGAWNELFTSDTELYHKYPVIPDVTNDSGGVGKGSYVSLNSLIYLLIKALYG